jgi:hypothetical protein
MSRWLAPAVTVAVAGCATAQLYDGPSRPAAELARIDGDPRINAGLPFAAVIRKVDAHTIGIGYARVAVEAGPHVLLVDCIMAPTHVTTRFELPVEVAAGHRYALVADAAPGNQRCGAVRLEPR